MLRFFPHMTTVLAAGALLLLAGCAADAPATGGASGTDSAAASTPRPPDAAAPRLRAITLDARERPADSTLRALAALGATHLALVPFGFQPATDAPRIRMHPGSSDDDDDDSGGGGWYSETDAGIRALARRADSLGMGLVLKPHIWVGREGQSRLKIAFDDERDWQRWQQQYRRFLMHYARLAEEVGADLLVVGTELAGISAARDSLWRRLIADVRAVYGGRLTYAANWHDEYETVPFWDALDYVGVQGYFPLSEKDDPSTQALRAGWAPHVRTLRRVSAEVGKPVFFTELGYRNARDAAARPWHWPAAGDAPAPRLQARLYEAFFAEVWPNPWVAGAAVWKWPAAPERRRAAGFWPHASAAEAIRRGFESSDSK
jgi:hypothetical protein